MTLPPILAVGIIGSPPDDLERDLIVAGLLIHHQHTSPREGVGGVARPPTDDVLAWFLAVPVPLTPSGGANTDPLADAARFLGRLLRPGQLVVVTGNIPPFTTGRVVVPALSEFGPSDVSVAYTARTAVGRVVGGVSERAGELAAALFARLAAPVTRLPTAEAAEACGAVGAVVRTVRAALANELYQAYERLGADGRAVLAAAGHLDLVPYQSGEAAAALFAWGCRRVRVEGRVLATALAVNATVVDELTTRVADALNATGRPLRGSSVVVVCRPADAVTDPAAGVMHRLIAQGATIRVCDPNNPVKVDRTNDHCALLFSNPPAGWATSPPVAVVDARQPLQHPVV